MDFNNEDNKYKMVAPDIDRLIRCFDRRSLNPIASTPELMKAIEPLFELLEPVAPLKKNDEAKTIWLRIPRGTIDDYDSFEDLKEYCEVKTYEEYEQMWKEDYPDEFKWYRLVVVKSLNADGTLRFYGMSLGNETIISASLDDRLESPCYYPEDIAVLLCKLIIPAVEESMSLLKVEKYNSFVENNLPYQLRVGVVKRSEIWEVDPESKIYAFDGLTEDKVKAFKELIRSGINDEEKIGRIKSFTANDFFKACKLGYEAIGKNCEGYNLADLYMHYSDGRDEGLTGKGYGLNEGPGIDFDDPKAWDEWYFDKKRCGGHPWEVVPGGNSTHMSLYVAHDESNLGYQFRSGKISKEEYDREMKNAGYFFEIVGVQRQFESVNFYLALSSAGLPVIVQDAEEMLARFEGTDYVGVVPHHVITRYCSGLFPGKYGEMIDFTHVYKEEDAWFDRITWLPEEPARLKKN